MTQEEMLSQMEMMLQPLQQVNASQAETIKKLTEQNESLQSRIKELTAQIAWLNRQLFGRKSEKLPIIDPNYPDLFAGMLPENAQQIADAHDEAVEKIIKTKEERRQEKKNRIMMEDLPVLEQVILTPDNLDTNLYKKIGQEVTRIVEHKPGQLYIKEIIREKIMKFSSSPFSLQMRCSLNPKNQPIEHLPLCAIPLNVLCIWMRWFLHTLSGVLSTKLMPVHLPSNTFLMNRARGMATSFSSSTKRL